MCAYIGFSIFVVVRCWRFEGFSPGFGVPTLRGFGGYRGSGALYMCGLGCVCVCMCIYIYTHITSCVILSKALV